MGVYTRKRDNKVFKTLEGKEVWICDRCETTFIDSEVRKASDDFFNHICDKGEIIYPKPLLQQKLDERLEQLNKMNRSELTARIFELEFGYPTKVTDTGAMIAVKKEQVPPK